jgi:hypothetical protein
LIEPVMRGCQIERRPDRGAMEKEEFVGKKGRVMPGGGTPNIMTF